MENNRWAIVFANGFVSHDYMRFTRRDAIAEFLVVWRHLRSSRYPGLSDAQFWRVMKRTRGISVRRIVLKVAR